MLVVPVDAPHREDREAGMEITGGTDSLNRTE